MIFHKKQWRHYLLLVEKMWLISFGRWLSIWTSWRIYLHLHFWQQSYVTLDSTAPSVEASVGAHEVMGTLSRCSVFQAVNQAGAGPYSELVLCQTPASAPDPVSTVCVLEEETLNAYPDSPSVCLVLNWEEPCNNGSEILAYNIDLGDTSITVGNTTTHVMKDLLPETTYRWVQESWNTAAWTHTSEHGAMEPLGPQGQMGEF